MKERDIENISAVITITRLIWTVAWIWIPSPAPPVIPDITCTACSHPQPGSLPTTTFSAGSSPGPPNFSFSRRHRYWTLH